jgi:hypothetical protein
MKKAAACRGFFFACANRQVNLFSPLVTLALSTGKVAEP